MPIFQRRSKHARNGVPVHPARIQFPGPHIGLCVSDVARSRRFFIEQLGFLPDSVLDLPVGGRAEAATAAHL